MIPEEIKKTLETEYGLIPIDDITDEARIISVRWHENATDWIGDKHKLASDIMNYAKRQIAKAEARIKELEEKLRRFENPPNNIKY